MKGGALIALALMVTGQSSPPAADPVQLIKQQTKAVAADRPGRYSGVAWHDLVADAAGAQFVMVGEQHGSGDIARFETALFRELARRGFTHLALEVGPMRSITM
jgi:erythromycin esterase-like protein